MKRIAVDMDEAKRRRVEKQKIRGARSYAKHKERLSVKAKKWYAENRERVLAKRKIYAEANKEAIAERARTRYWGRYRDKKAAKLYNITVEEAQMLLAIEHCAICSNKATDIDHDHVTNKVRGRLCTNCNNGLGRFQDNPLRLRAAANYLEEAASA